MQPPQYVEADLAASVGPRGWVGGIQAVPSLTGLCTITSRAVERDELLLVVDVNVAITERTAARSEPEIEAGVTPGHAKIALAAHRAGVVPAPGDRRDRLFDRCPWDPPPALHPLLDGSGLRPLLAARRSRVLGEWRDLGGPALGVSPAAWLRARWWASSRSFGLPSPHGVSLIPALDLIDHSDAPTTRWRLTRGGTVELRAGQDLPAFAPLVHRYGIRSNLRWLLGWGFTVPDNPLQEAGVLLPGRGIVRVFAQPRPADLAALWSALGEEARTDPAAARAELAAACRARLEGLPAWTGDAPAHPLAADVLRVRQDERAALERWSDPGFCPRPP